MNFSSYAYSNTGDRKNNQDYYLYNNVAWIVADGLGGHESGEIASKTAATAIDEALRQNAISLLPENLKALLDIANSSVCTVQKSDKKFESMRTTIVFALTDGIDVTYANVGDSRFYYFSGGKITHQSEDHSVSATSVKMGDIKYEDIRGDADRNKLIKVLGDNEILSVKIPQTYIKAQSGDAFLLCSDGFWEHVYETEMEADLAKSDTPREWVDFMLKRLLLKTGNKNTDNFTVIGVMIK